MEKIRGCQIWIPILPDLVLSFRMPASCRSAEAIHLIPACAKFGYPDEAVPSLEDHRTIFSAKESGFIHNLTHGIVLESLWIGRLVKASMVLKKH